MKQMRQVARNYLEQKQHKLLCGDEAAENLLQFLLSRQLFAGDYRPVIKGIMQKPIDQMNQHEISVYLTALAAADRIHGTFEGGMKNGTIASLLERWLELEESA